MPADYESEGKGVSFPISTVNYYRNYTFLGRDDLLDTLQDHLKDNESTESANSDHPIAAGKKHDPRCCILHGLGGIGKTQTALEYTYKYRPKYEAIFWVQSDTDQALSAAFADVAKALQMVEDLGANDGQNQGRAVKRAEKWLSTTRESRKHQPSPLLTLSSSILVVGL